MQFLGVDIGSSSVKVSVLDGDSGSCLDSASFPDTEMTINSPVAGWAEQDPDTWWYCIKKALQTVMGRGRINISRLAGIGIAYQMHGLVAVDRNLKPVRPSIIWCDSRAVMNGELLLKKAGNEKCIHHLLNSPGNFTLSKLHWVKINEPEVFQWIFKFMLPGDYIAMRMTGEITTTVTGLSEAILWDFSNNDIAGFALQAAGIDPELVPKIVPVFGTQGTLSRKAALDLGLPAGIPITYRAGDQPNNAFALNVLNPGETAATAGTSGVIYGVTDRLKPDPNLRVNTFAHVNHSPDRSRLGMLLCINGAGIANSWLRRICGHASFESMNNLASGVDTGSGGLLFQPFGNGAERMLQNKAPGASFSNIDFNIHGKEHLVRAIQEGIAFAFYYGMNILEECGMKADTIRAGHANLFLSNVFCRSLASLSGTKIELYNTDGALGAARGAALGAGFYKNLSDTFQGLSCIRVVEPSDTTGERLGFAFEKWKNLLPSP